MQHGYLEEDRYPHNGSSHPTNDNEYLADYDIYTVTLWFDGGCMPKVLIDNDDQFNDNLHVI